MPACSVCGEYLIKMRTCFSIFQLPEEGQKWGFLIWLLFSYCGLFCIACMSAGKVSYTLRYLNLMTCFPAYLWGSLVSFLLHTFYWTLHLLILQWCSSLYSWNHYTCTLVLLKDLSLQWLTRRQAHLLRAQQGIPISEYGVGSDHNNFEFSVFYV